MRFPICTHNANQHVINVDTRGDFGSALIHLFILIWVFYPLDFIHYPPTLKVAEELENIVASEQTVPACCGTFAKYSEKQRHLL